MHNALSIVYSNNIQESDSIELANAYATDTFELVNEAVASAITEDSDVSSEYVSAMMIDRLTMLESELLAESLLDDVEYDLTETAQNLMNSRIEIIGSIPSISILEAEDIIYSPISEDSFVFEGLSASAAAAKKAMLLRHAVKDTASAAAKLHKSQSGLIKSVKHIKANLAQQQGALAKAKTTQAKAMIEKGIATAQKKLAAKQAALKAVTGKAVGASKASAAAVKAGGVGKAAVGVKAATVAKVAAVTAGVKSHVGLSASAKVAKAAMIKKHAIAAPAKAHAVQKALIGDVQKLKTTLAKQKAAMANSKNAAFKANMKSGIARTQSKLAAKQASLKAATGKAVGASKASAAAQAAPKAVVKGAGKAAVKAAPKAVVKGAGKAAVKAAPKAVVKGAGKAAVKAAPKAVVKGAGKVAVKGAGTVVKGTGIAAKGAAVAAKGALLAKAGLATAAVAATSSIGAFALSAAFVGAVAGLGAVVAKRKLEMSIAERTLLGFGKKYKVGGVAAAKSEADKTDAAIKADTKMDRKSKAKAAIGAYGKFLADGGGAAVHMIAQETRKEQPGFKSDGLETLLGHRAQSPNLKTMKATLRQFTSARKTIVTVLNKGNSQAASYFVGQLNKAAKI